MADQAAKDKKHFPDVSQRERLERYAHGDRIYEGKHYEAFSVKGEKDFSVRYNRLRYVVANFGSLMTDVLADMLFGETPSLDYNDGEAEKFSQAVFDDNQLMTQLYESALVNSRMGDSVFKMRMGKRNPQSTTAKDTVIIEEVTPAIYFPELDQMSTRYVPQQEVIATTFENQGNWFLLKEIHTPGKIENEVYLYDKKSGTIQAQESSTTLKAKFGIDPKQETKVDRNLVFHVPNMRDGSGFWGISDYRGLDSLFFALNNRITKVDNILDKHSDPMLAVPTGFLDDEGKVRKEHMGIYEVDSDNPNFNRPEYVIWDANLDAAFKEIDKLMDFLFMFSSVSPASVKDSESGAAESGRALKFKLLSTIRKMRRKQRYYDQAIRDIMFTAQEFAKANSISVNEIKPPAKAERPKIKWPDGVVNDEVEATEVEVARIGAGLSSPADSISRLDNIPIDDAKKKAKEIEDANRPKVPEVPGGITAGGPADQNIGGKAQQANDPNAVKPQQLPKAK